MTPSGERTSQEERIGPLLVERHRKADGRALILYRQAPHDRESSEDGEASDDREASEDGEASHDGATAGDGETVRAGEAGSDG
jgi:hypothetical protein